MYVVFTDLDGTLLDHQTYSFEEALPALNHLRQIGAPCVFVTSKTRAETELWRSRIGNSDPFVVENGGGAYIPCKYFPFAVPGAARKDDYEVLSWGHPYEQLVSGLRIASAVSGVPVAGFHDLSAEQVAAMCGLPLDQAELAKQREYDEPFLIPDSSTADHVLRAIERQGFRWTRGGRFWHISGKNDKAEAVTTLTRLYEWAHEGVTTIGLGDSLNDSGFLNEVRLPVLIRSSSLEELRRLVPGGRVSTRPGPAGWNEMVLALTRV